MLRYLSLFILTCCFYTAYSQQDMDLHLTGTYLSGKNIVKVKRDYYDPYLWVLTQNNEVYRINSITKVVDDYTSRFSAYSGYKFIDIVGADPDLAFIATNSTIIIEYNSGSLKTIDASYGVRGPINSIGIDNADRFNNGTNGKTLLIATDNGLSYYDYANDQKLDNFTLVPSRIFENTYRSQMLSYLQSGGDPDQATTNPATMYLAAEYIDAIYASYIWYQNSVFGYKLNSAFYTEGSYQQNTYVVDQMNIFWGTEKGLFQNNRTQSLSSANLYRHYLDGINVNKITSIYGLLAFGNLQNPGLIKENLLIGTDKGLYFTNSEYTPPANATNTPQYSMFHFNDLGNKKINDICVNANTYDYAIPNLTRSVQNVTCENGVWVGAADGLYLLAPDYSAYLDPNYKVNSIVFDGLPSTTNELQTCTGTAIKAVVQGYDNKNMAIQWYKDGQLMAGEINYSLNITNTGVYNAILYDPCSGLHFETNQLKVNMSAAPVFTFNYPNELSYCDGSTATLKTEDNANYQYRWYKDGVLNGNITATLTTNQTGKYKLEVSGCAGNWIPTKEVQVDFIKVPVPVITADKPAYCIGDQATLAINFTNDGTNTVNWFLDGNIMPANQNKTSINTTQAGSYTVSISSNLANCSQSSTGYTLGFTPPPTFISLDRTINTTLCDGQTVDLKATYTGGTIAWSTGETTAQISVKQSATYTATVKALAGCEITKDISIQFLPNPVLSLPDATLCQFINQTITLTAPAGFTKYEWNGQQGSTSFLTAKLGKVILKVTDNNGCTASQTINITSHCDDIHFPNAFTPNGDGINDKWVIEGLQGDVSTSVKIFNRYGELIFQSTGYATPWDGTTNGKKLPAGVYYYVVNAHQTNQVISGSVTIIY